MIDSGILGEPDDRAPTSRARRSPAPAGTRLADVRAAGSRGAAVALMREGVREVVVRQFAEGRVQGVLCLGGAEGALLGAAAMQALPVGVPKLLVSPCASGRRRFGDFVGESDVCVMHSVVDILGLNGISRPIFDNAAAAMAGMVRDAGSALGHARRALRRDHDAGPDDAGRDAPARGARARRPRAGDLPRQRRRRAGDGAPVRGGRAAGRRGLHALRAGQLAAWTASTRPAPSG